MQMGSHTHRDKEKTDKWIS